MRRYTGKNRTHTICGFGAALAFLLTIGLVGGIDKGYLAFMPGAWLVLAGVVVFALLVWGSGALGGRT